MDRREIIKSLDEAFLRKKFLSKNLYKPMEEYMAQRSSPLRVFKPKHPTWGDALQPQGARKQFTKLTRSMK